VEDVVPADHDPEHAVPGGERQQDEQGEVVHVPGAEPPEREIDHALHAEKEEHAEDPPFPGADRCGAAVAEQLSVVVPVRHGRWSSDSLR
jgi:hypothetical protein